MQISDYVDFDLTVSKVELALTKICPTNWNFKQKYRQNYGLVYILSGCAEYAFQNRVEIANANDILYFSKGDTYQTKAFSDTPFAFIVISFELAHDATLPFHTINKINHTKRFQEMFEYIEEISFAKGVGYKLCCRSMVQQLIYHLLMEYLHTSKTTQNTQATIEYIENYYGNKINIETLAKIAGVTPSHYRRKFKEIYGVSPNEYINRLRIEKAKDMLKSGMFSQSEIAKLCGFENVYYFSKVFKKFTNLSPGAY